MTGKLGVLIHGAGWVAGQHAAAFSNNPHTRVVAVSSRSKASAGRLIEQAGLAGAEAFGDLDAALRHPGIDIVCVCTPRTSIATTCSPPPPPESTS